MKKYRRHQPRGRFYIERDLDGWELVDALDGYCVTFETRARAQEARRFAAQYVRKWGDIDFATFPYDLTTPLRYEPEKEKWHSVLLEAAN